jgi:hypothetical protein
VTSPTSRSFVPQTFLVFDMAGKKVGSIPESTSLDDAAETAAFLLFNRKSARKVVSSSSDERGVFVAHGRIDWVRYGKGEVCNEIRFQLRAEEKEGK